jgi:hypothetical protein
VRALQTLIAFTGAALLAGCAQDAAERTDDRTPYEELSAAADSADGFGPDQPAGVTPVQGGATQPGALTATGNFTGTQPDAPPGNVTLTQDGDGTRILINVQRYTAGAELRPVIVAARCGSTGATVLTVPRVITIPAEGVASLDTRVDLSTDRLLDGNHSVRLMNPQEPGSTDVVLACADLPETGTPRGP